jgi:hypothetical protein
MNWIRKSGCAVTEYYGSFPVPKVMVKVVPVPGGEGVVFGRTAMNGEIPQITVAISEFVTESSLRDDWIMTHEMVHLAFPFCLRRSPLDRGGDRHPCRADRSCPSR